VNFGFVPFEPIKPIMVRLRVRDNSGSLAHRKSHFCGRAKATLEALSATLQKKAFLKTTKADSG
jgi:hypothetical protein